MDIKRGAPNVVSARGTGAAQLHQQPLRPAAKSMDMRGPAQVKRGTVRVPQTPAATLPAESVVTPAPVAAVTPPQALPDVKPARIVVDHPPRRHPHQSAQIDARLERAKSVPLSGHVSRFGGNSDFLVEPEAIITPAVVTPEPVAPVAEVVMPAAAIASHQSLAGLVGPAVPTAPLRAKPSWKQYAAVGTAVVAMGAFVWSQNYPKLTIQAAASKAGVAATTPSYLPTSYSLAAAKSAPGDLTLDFKSPSETGALTISQQRTTWDTKTLVDNYIATSGDGYSAVNGQGLTIYLFNSTGAAWVNHGIWYTITGTARLSRDQILKIAYGL